MCLLALALTGLDFTPQRLNVEGRVMWVEASDLNSDGGPDLVAMFRKNGNEAHRFLAVFMQQADGRYPEKPNEVRTVPDDASVATVADCDGDGAGEIVFMTSSGISAITVVQGKLSATPVEWVKAQSATLFSDKDALPLWALCGDWHKNGGHEIALWGTGTLSFYRASAPGQFALVDRLRAAPRATNTSQPSGTFRGTGVQRDLSIATTYTYPELIVGDYQGDGKADLFLSSEEKLRIYVGDGTKYAERPSVALDFNFRTPEERNRRNGSIAAQALDLNGDGKTDYVMNKVTGSINALKSETAVHLNKGGFSKKPDQLIKREGFSALAQFADLNGDGRLEMIEAHSDIGILGLARVLVSRKVTVDALITQNTGGIFDLENTAKFDITFALDFGGGPVLRGPIPHLSQDIDGDGYLDFLASPDGETLQLFLGKKNASFNPAAALKLNVEISPYTAPFYDARAKRVHILSFFRDMDGKEGRILVLIHNR